MKHTIVITLIALSSFTLIRCTAKKATTNTAMPTNSIVTELKNSYTEVQMQEGKLIWQQKCGKCHDLPKPENYTVSKMDRILPNMSMRAKLNDEQSGKVRAYLLTHAKM